MEQPIMPTNSLSSQSLKQKIERDSPDAPPPPNPGIQYKKRGKITVVACVQCRKRKSKCDGTRPTCMPCQAREDHNCHYDMTNEQRRLTVLREQVDNVSEEKTTLEAVIQTLQSASEQDAVEVLRRLRAGVGIHTLAQQLHAVQLLTSVRRENTTPEYTAHSGPSDYYTSQQSSPRPITPLATNQYQSLVNLLSSCSSVESEEISRRLRAGEEPSVILAAWTNETLRPQIQQLRGSPGIEDEYAGNHGFGAVDSFVRKVAGVGTSPRRSMLSGPACQWTLVTDDADYIESLFSLYFSWLHPIFQSFPESYFRRDYATGGTKYCCSLLVNAVCAAGCTFSDRAGARSNPLDYRTAGAEFFEEAVRLLHLVEVPSTLSVAATYILSHLENARGRVSSSWCFAGQSGRMALDINLHLKTEKETMEDATEMKARQHTFWGCFIGDQFASFNLGRLPQLQMNSITVELPAISKDDDLQPWQQPGVASFSLPSYQSSLFHELARLSKIINSTLNLFFAPLRVMCGTLYLDELQKYLAWHARLPPCLSSTEDAPPHVLSLHMYYQAAILHLFRPLLGAKFTGSGSKTDPRRICRTSADAISQLFSQYRQLTGLNGICTFQLSCLQSACSIHVLNLPAIMPTKHLTDALNAFQDMAYSNAWASGSLNQIKDLAERRGIALPLEVEAALNRNGNAQLPNFTSHIAQAPREGLVSMRFSPDRSEPSGRPGKRARVESSRTSTPQRVCDYLYVPFAHQPAPLLGPVHTWTNDDMFWNCDFDTQAQEIDGLEFSADPYQGLFLPVEFQQQVSTH